MPPKSPSRPCAGFTLVELLLATVLAVLVAAILAALIHGLLTAGDSLAGRVRGPFAARAALRALSREAACAFAPPVEELAPLQLGVSTEPDQPRVQLVFYAPVPAATGLIGGYDLEQITWRVQPFADGHRELQRISVPCSGPFTNVPTTNLWLAGPFELAIEAVTNGTGLAVWPPPGMDPPALPPALRMTLAWPGEAPLHTEVLIQTANGLRSPVERPAAPAAPGPAE